MARSEELTDEPAHYRLAPSSSKRWLACPYSQWAPEGEPHPTAAAGNIVHRLSEEWLTSPAVFKPTLLIEQAAYRAALEFVDDKQARAIAAVGPVYVRTVSAIEGELFTERKIKHDSIADFGGTIDALRVTDNVIHIVDMKTGKWPVYANAPQLKCYALFARQEFPECDDIYVTVVQPRSFREPQTKKLTHRALDKFELQVIEASQSDEVVPGEHCRFCSLRPECKPGQQYARQAGW